MSDKHTTIQEIRDWVREFRERRGWIGPNQNTKNLAISLVLEAVELLEHYQWLESEEVLGDKTRQEEVAFELVDVLYWVVTIADVYGIELSEVLKRKLAKTAKRYPEKEFPVGMKRKEILNKYYTLKKQYD